MPRVRRLTVLAAVAAALVLVPVVTRDQAPPSSAGRQEDASGCSAYVATGGSDSGTGSSADPWRRIGASVEKLVPGETLCVAPGTFVEEVSARPPVGRPDARITLRGLGEGERRPVIRGGFALVDPDYWTISNLRFTNPTPRNPDDRLVSILAGTGWVFKDNEVWNGPYAGLLVGASEKAGPPEDYVIRGNAIHDTGATNLYLNPSRASSGGVVEQNLFFHSGTENVKLGWGGDQPCSAQHQAQFGIGGVAFRYNTLHGARRGALIVAEPGGQAKVDVYRNLFTGEPDHLVRYDSVAGCLGDAVHVHDNAGGLAPKFSEDFGDSPTNVAHEHGNVFPLDPGYASEGVDGFRPGNPEARGYGRYGFGG